MKEPCFVHKWNGEGACPMCANEYAQAADDILATDAFIELACQIRKGELGDDYHAGVVLAKFHANLMNGEETVRMCLALARKADDDIETTSEPD